MVKNNHPKPLELYVHIPFCIRKCLYCDFLSGSAGKDAMDAYVEALLLETEGLSRLGRGHEVISVFIGGGTPSILREEQIVKIMEALQNSFVFVSDPEITIESNPGTLTRKKLLFYRQAGINRLSLGLQSVVQKELTALGRIHSYEEFHESFLWAREAGFSNINVDLMFAIPGQTPASWEMSLKTVAELGPEHISAYSLIIEEGTPFAEKLPLDLPDEDTEAGMYDDTAAILSGYSYERYEISNYAREGYECIHNLGYWQGREYLGIGLGASSLYDGMRCSNTRDMQEYLRDSAEPQKLRRQVEVLTEKDCMEEFMFLGLRMIRGVSEKEFCRRFGVSMMETYGDVLEKYRKMGFMEHKEEYWFFTEKGIHVSNPILADFLFDTLEEE